MKFSVLMLTNIPNYYNIDHYINVYVMNEVSVNVKGLIVLLLLVLLSCQKLFQIYNFSCDFFCGQTQVKTEELKVMT